ncbi:MAG: efflux RND transporter periplasmic adaptor subunit [Steroidobacteraceae bacterium]|nr:efflux RND transporter periplasmic adaptor subunit [Steroidobacteraceae bacterium]MCW5573965.1 efflux RND transporter periplasmic adaptor subunit [Steroidobacteraceae bacterium]
MNRKKLLAAAATVVAIVALALIWRAFTRDTALPYRYATVERGDIRAAVAATGALSAVTTVQVGTQVSGRVVATYADFNDRVTKGQLIARIDPTLLEQAVRDAQAGLERSRALYQQADVEYQRNLGLFKEKVLTEIEFDTTRFAREVAAANVKSAEVALERARQNLAYTEIYAPIDGIVVERNVDVGQTVAASLSAPQLFLIANDLARMQILASVAESDIGAIHKGQPVTFTVQAFPEQSFTGTVQQVRLQSTTTENVVNYTVVIEVANPGEKLLPGMTASVDFVTGEAKDVLTIPNAALRFRATEAMLAEVRKAGGTQGQRASGTRPAGEARGSGDARGTGERRPADLAILWYVDGNGRLARLPVRTGLTDGQRTEISGEGLKEGMNVIIGVTQSGASAQSSSPFQSAPMQGGPRGF